jgi:glycosyltransferase involved in cell wall biosynthesis
VARLLLITPVRNEAANIERTVRAVAAQTRRPDLWLVVDDDSTDGTGEILRGLAAELPFLRVLEAPPRHTQAGPDRLALAAEARAFNWALATVAGEGFTHLGKLDGDVELPRDYFERLLLEFARDQTLGLAGGTLLEPSDGGWREDPVPGYHVRGALKLYSRNCFAAIGGIEERLGWDTIDETYARMRGFATRSLPELVALHHRPVGTADGALRGHARHGECAYICRYGAAWVLLRSVKVARYRPLGLAGAAFLFGYARAALGSRPKVEDEQFRRWVRKELWGRLLGRPVSASSRA